MEPSIHKLFLDNLKRYKASIKDLDSDLTPEKKNDITASYYIVYKMRQRYGCPNCRAMECSCDAVPEPHPVINTKGW